MLRIGAALFYYKLGKTLLQIGAASLLQIGGKCCYKLRQNVLQIGASITNKGNYYRLGHNNCFSHVYYISLLAFVLNNIE